MAYPKLKRILSVTLSILMLLPILIIAPTNTVSAAPSAIAASMSSLAEASKILTVYNTAYVTGGLEHSFGENVGVYAFDEKEGALSLKKASSDYMGGYYRFHIMSKNAPITNQTWMVVSYKTNATEKATMTFKSNGKDTAVVTLASDISVSNGKYVRTTPVNLNGKGVSDLFTRLKNGTHSALAVTLSEDTPDSVYFYINEICFFGSKAAAEDYVKSGKLPDDTNEFDSTHRPGKYTEGLYNDGNVTIGTSVYLPEDYSPEKEYSLIITFHDQGGGVNKTVANNAKELYGDNYIVFAPICPTGSKWTVDKLKNGTYVYDSNDPSKVMTATISYVKDVLLETYNIDRSRIYAVGQSLGGGGVWDFITRAPELVAAAFPVAGYCDPSQAVNISDDVAIWLVHSKQDKSISVSAAHAMAATLMNLGKTNFNYTEYDLSDPAQKELFEESWERSANWEHWAWVPAFKDTEMLDWLFSTEKPSKTINRISRFTDVKSSDTYYKAVNYVADAGLFKGITDTTFEPETAMTRAMFVTVLGRLSGVDVSKYTTVSFKDVVEGSWYAPYVEWAAANGIVSGIGDGKYGVNDIITIEQACTILARYAENKAAPHNTGLTFSAYSDAHTVSDWAKDGMQWAMSNSIYMGQGSELTPQSDASRGLIATIFYCYSLIFGK
ncbi:MAG: S-layer homology domain-containing protein [Clostridia bacterium]|nr:S-layer homology domain-containing protein [Clostridia bacterium]